MFIYSFCQINLIAVTNKSSIPGELNNDNIKWSMNDEHWILHIFLQDFECIPLQTIHSEACSQLTDEDIFYSDEFGNYVFPIVNQHPGTCSCPNR